MGRAPSHKKVNIPKAGWVKEQQEFHSKTQYPYCRGTFPDCPETIIPDVVASVCKICPIYRKK